mgnify:CR=1 FL=1
MRPASAISPFRSAPLRQALKEVPPTMKISGLEIQSPGRWGGLRSNFGAIGGVPVTVPVRVEDPIQSRQFQSHFWSLEAVTAGSSSKFLRTG